MATKLLYVNQPGSMLKIFEKVRHAQTPDRFTADFLQTKLGFRGGNYRQFIPLAKKIGFLGSDGVPTDIYKQFRNSATSGAAMAQALKLGYREIFERNEYANNLTKDQLKGMVVEVTGLDSKNRVVQLIARPSRCSRSSPTSTLPPYLGRRVASDPDVRVRRTAPRVQVNEAGVETSISTSRTRSISFCPKAMTRPSSMPYSGPSAKVC